jgi:hypothetical protein
MDPSSLIVVAAYILPVCSVAFNMASGGASVLLEAYSLCILIWKPWSVSYRVSDAQNSDRDAMGPYLIEKTRTKRMGTPNI